jgi:hypothetical protein
MVSYKLGLEYIHMPHNVEASLVSNNIQDLSGLELHVPSEGARRTSIIHGASG